MLTAVMILVFLGSMRATVAVFFRFRFGLTAFIAAVPWAQTINAMVLGGLALAFSRLIDNSVVVLENIFRHLEMGEATEVAAERGGREVALPVLAATFTTIVVFFPVIFLYGVSKFLFTALALSVVLSLLASYTVAMTVVPLFCARFIKGPGASPRGPRRRTARVISPSPGTPRALQRLVQSQFERSWMAMTALLVSFSGGPFPPLPPHGVIVVSLFMYPLLDFSFFPRTDPGQFMMNIKLPSGTRIGLTEQEVARVETSSRGYQ